MIKPIRDLLNRLFANKTNKVLDIIDNVTLRAESTVDVYVEPVRKSIIKRFPILFSLLVTFGVTATFLGIEKIILKYEFFDKSPELVLFLGISILVFTGTLYKKLG